MSAQQPEDFIHHFRQIQPKFSRFYASTLAKVHLTLSQYALLNQLAGDNKLAMNELGERLYISSPAVTNLVDRLEKKGFLTRLLHPRDRRIFLLKIQPKGEKIVQKVQAQVLRFLLKTLNQLNLQERKTVTRFYALLSQTLDEALNVR